MPLHGTLKFRSLNKGVEFYPKILGLISFREGKSIIYILFFGEGIMRHLLHINSLWLDVGLLAVVFECSIRDFNLTLFI